MDAFAKLTIHRSTEHSGRYWLELALGGDGRPDRARCIGDVLRLPEAKSKEKAAAAALLLAGYAITA